MLVCDGHVIHAHHLPPTLQTAEASGTVTRLSLKDALAAYEKDLIQDALKTTRGNRAKAARLLNTTERILNYQVGKVRDRLAKIQNITCQETEARSQNILGLQILTSI